MNERRGGAHYVEALEWMNQMQYTIAAAKELPVRAASQVPIRLSRGSAEQWGPLNTAETPKAPLATECDLPTWNTERYFETGTVQDVKACIEAGADSMARDDSFSLRKPILSEKKRNNHAAGHEVQESITGLP